MDAWGRRHREGYDRVAHAYAERTFAELTHKPFDRAWLDRFAGLARPVGPVCDLGCGAGQVARYLHDRGLDVTGIDLSETMVAEAARRSPDIIVRTGDMRALADPDGAFGGIAAFYSIIHIPRSELLALLMELRRVLRPGGALLLAFHVGQADIHLTDWYDQPVAIDFLFHDRAEVERLVQAAGFTLLDSAERPPYPDIEAATQRAYLLARL